ncbi:MAG: GNAT family N-acetyltransferase [Meiothermus sp.]|nr:GNAT family N-acetyltransferase [Meiothermus sp.]
MDHERESLEQTLAPLGNMPVVIRAAAVGDAPVLAALGRRVFAETYGAQLPGPVLQAHLETALSPEVFAAKIAEGKAHYLLAEAGGVAAGFVKLEGADGAVEIAKFYVDKGFHGTGLAGGLMGAGLEWARAKGFGTVWLLVWEENPRAVRFYRKYGFEVVGRQEVWVGPVAFQDHRMQRGLA